MENFILISADKTSDNKFHADVVTKGDMVMLAQAIAMSIRNDEKFRAIFADAFINLLSGEGFKTDVKEGTPSPQKKKAD